MRRTDLVIASLIRSHAPAHAFRAARRLDGGLRQLGAESQLLTLDEVDLDGDEPRCREPGLRFSLPGRGLDVSVLPAVSGADVVHLHDVAGVLSPESLRSLGALGKPIVWTLSDARPFTGGCHEPGTCERFESTCSACPLLPGEAAHLPSLALRHALALLAAAPLAVVAGSGWQAGRARRSRLLGARRTFTIAPGIDGGVFSPEGRAEARRSLGLEPDGVAVAVDLPALGRPATALRLLREAIARLPPATPSPRVLVLGAGELPLDGLEAARREDPPEERERARLLSACDLYLVPGAELERPDGILEAMACGLPVLAPAEGSALEVVDDGTEGWLVPPGSAAATATALARALADGPERARRGAAARRRVEAGRGVRREAGEYLAVFEQLVAERPARRTSAPARRGAPVPVLTSSFSRSAPADEPAPAQPPTGSARGARPGALTSPARAPWPRAAPSGPPLPSALPGGAAWPRISIVTPSFNHGAFLEETILSILNQGYPDVELVVMDGGSSDETGAILERYREHLAVCRSEPDAGQSHALNKGFARTTGEILTWLNSDDMLAPGALAGVALALQDRSADLVAGICEVHEDGELVRRHLTACREGPLPLDELLDVSGRWIPGQFFWQPEVFFRRGLWERAGAHVDGSLRYCMDYDLWIRFAAAGARLRVIGRPVARFRSHPQQKTAEEATFRPELDQVAARYRAAGASGPPAPPAWRKERLRVAAVSEAGFQRGAGVAAGRLARALTLAGDEVLPLALRGGASTPLPPGELVGRRLQERLAALAPDAVLLGELPAAQVGPEVLRALAAIAPAVPVRRLAVPLDTFRPRDADACREKLGLPRDRFVVVFPATEPRALRDGWPRLEEALRLASLPGVLPVALGSGGPEDRGRYPGIHWYEPDDEPGRATLLSAADVLVAPLPDRALDVLLAEAAACGTPSVACAPSQDGRSPAGDLVSRLVPAGDPAALAGALRELHQDPVARRDQAALARLHAENELSFELAYHDLFHDLQAALQPRGQALPPRISLLRRSAGALPETEVLFGPRSGPVSTVESPAAPVLQGEVERVLLAYYTEQLACYRRRRFPWYLSPRAWWARINRQLLRREVARLRRRGA